MTPDDSEKLEDIDRRLYRIECDTNETKNMVSALDTDTLLVELRELKTLMLAEYQGRKRVRVPLRPRRPRQ
jgi:hypothetical protein